MGWYHFFILYKNIVFFNNVSLKEKDTELTIAKFRLDSVGNFKSLITKNEILTPYELKGY